MFSRDKGQRYERLAQRWLLRSGLKPVETNYHSRFGEIDLIMLDDATLCFIEVKYRGSNAYGGTAYSIPAAKQRRITQAALHFLTQHRRYQQHALRFDALFITPADGDQHDFEWIRNAFYAE